MTPWLDDGDVRLYHGDNLDVLRQLPDRSVHMCATSPPFYGLRDYGTGLWEGGDPDCAHSKATTPSAAIHKEGFASPFRSGDAFVNHREEGYGASCGKCGARRVDQQIGLEDTPDLWVERLVAVFREVRRVLRDDGTLWVEIGDSYTSGESGRNDGDRMGSGGFGGGPITSLYAGKPRERQTHQRRVTKPKDLLGQPWLLAFALRADGWYLRSEIIWARPNPMPESVTDRPTKSHSTVFLLSKAPRYYFDQDAIREVFNPASADRAAQGYDKAFASQFNGHPTDKRHTDGKRLAPIPVSRVPQTETLDGSDGEAPRGPDGRRVTAVKGQENSEQHRDGERWPNAAGANARSVWTIPTQPTPFAHFATWPEALVRRMVLAGTSERGCCPECGAPWVRDVERTPPPDYPDITKATALRATGMVNHRDAHGPQGNGMGTVAPRTLGWSPSCTHYVYGDVTDEWDGPALVPCTVLDPFAGSATTMLVARNHGRHSIGIELNEDYLRIAARRLQQLSLLTC